MCGGVCVGVCVSGCADVVSLYLPGSSLVLRGRCDMLVSYDASLGLGLLAKLFYVIVFFSFFVFVFILWRGLCCPFCSSLLSLRI